MPIEQTSLDVNFLGALVTILMGFLMVTVPRRYALLPLIIVTCYVTIGQGISIVGLNFTMMRVMIFLGWTRLILQGELEFPKLNVIDKTFIWWVAASIVIYVLKRSSAEDLVNRLGFAYNAVGLYFLCRILIQDMDDIVNIVKMLSIVIFPLAVMMLFEKLSGGNNPFFIFGGVPSISEIRNGSVRCQGSFRHPILAGTFGATLIPYFLALWFQGTKFRVKAVIGFVSATIITVTSSSSGPLISYAFGLIGMAMWAFKTKMRIIRWGIVIGLVTLQFVMKAPIWFLISRVGGIIGGGGYHRSELIDQAIQNFDEWWLAGATYTAHWMPTALAIAPESSDITNQYISEGVNGGIIKMGLFIAIIIQCFRGVGGAVRALESRLIHERILVWSLGAALLAHVAGYLSVTYFDQIIVSWYLLLAMISFISSSDVLFPIKKPKSLTSITNMSQTRSANE
jgi:hypothetical protein